VEAAQDPAFTLEFDEDALGFRVIFKDLSTEFTAPTRLLVPAKRHAGIVDAPAVDVEIPRARRRGHGIFGIFGGVCRRIGQWELNRRRPAAWAIRTIHQPRRDGAGAGTRRDADC
jgi:hypothetical protein